MDLNKSFIFVFFCVYVGDSGSWFVDVTMNIRPSSSSGVLFALVYNNSVPLSVAVVTQGEEDAVRPPKLLFEIPPSLLVATL